MKRYWWRWKLKQYLARPGRYHDGGEAIHGATDLDVETHKGKVVAVWFRCQIIPFRQIRVGKDRATVMLRSMQEYKGQLTGVEIKDPPLHKP